MLAIHAVEYVDEFGTRLKILAMEGGEVAGWIDISGWGVYSVVAIEQFVVLPSFRGRGVDRQLVDELVRLANLTPDVEEIVVAVRCADIRRVELFVDAGFGVTWVDDDRTGLVYLPRRRQRADALGGEL
jgi:ribosomal protein S18 acetylase RimI-like enzyme